MRVKAEDKDDPMTDNAALSYSIVKQESIPPNRADKNMFGMRETTGEIYILEGVDREVGVNLCFQTVTIRKWLNDKPRLVNLENLVNLAWAHQYFL